jgi:hypothetical protein
MCLLCATAEHHARRRQCTASLPKRPARLHCPPWHWRVTEARAEAKRLKQIVDQGGDPSGELQEERNAPTMAELCERFAAEHLPRLRESTRVDYGRLIRNHVIPVLGEHTKAAELKFADIDRLHRKITAAGHLHAADRCVAMLSKMFNLAMRWQMIGSNPAKGIERNPERPRRRYLAAAELARLTAALTEHADRQAADIVRMLLLTGARRGEVLGMRWADVDLGAGVWSKPASATKQGRDHSSPRSAPARAEPVPRGTGKAVPASPAGPCLRRPLRSGPSDEHQARVGGDIAGGRHHRLAHPRFAL